MNLKHRVQLGLRKVQLVDGGDHGGDQEGHLLREALRSDLESKLGGLDGVDEAGVEGGVGELGQVVSDGVHQQVVQVAITWRP